MQTGSETFEPSTRIIEHSAIARQFAHNKNYSHAAGYWKLVHQNALRVAGHAMAEMEDALRNAAEARVNGATLSNQGVTDGE